MTRAALLQGPALAAGLACAAAATACVAEAPVAAGWTVAIPAALTVDCAQPPDLLARMWISGDDAPCALDVDVAEGTTTGACDVRAGTTRRLTIDWYVAHPVGDGEVDVVLAQAREELDPQGADATLTIAPADVVVTGCRDMRGDAFEGASTIDVDGVARPVCDLDGSCGDDEAAACANVGEVCAGQDPLVP